MSDKEPEEKDGLLEWIKKLWLPVAGFFGAVILTYSFYKSWVEDPKIFPSIAIGSVCIFVILALGWAGFGKKTTKTQAIWPVGAYIINKKSVLEKPYQTVARMLFGFVLASTIFGVGYTGVKNYQEWQLKENKFVILVADFIGPDPENYQVTDELIKQLRSALQPYDDSVVLALGEAVEEAKGSEYAQTVGLENQADILLWGRYSVLEDEVVLNIHIENLTVSMTDMPSSLEYQNIPQVEGKKHFEFREHFSQEMGAFTLFMAGMARYELEDFASAEVRFTSALEQNAWPDDLLNQATVYYLRGLTRTWLAMTPDSPTNQNEYRSQAIADLTEAIQAFPEAEDAYFYRGQAYFQQAIRESKGNSTPTENSDRLYRLALEDMTTAIQNSSEPSIHYLMRANIYFAMGNLKQALTDYQMLTDSAYAFSQQGFIYAVLGENENALKAYTQAIQLDPSWNEIYSPHSSRGKIYVELGRYEEALKDFEISRQLGEPEYLYYQNCSSIYEAKQDFENALQYMDEAIRLDPTQPSSLILERGMLQYRFKQYQSAIEDFNKSLELGVGIDIFIYYFRGLSYAELQQYDLAISDLSQSITLSPLFAEAYYDRAATYFAMGMKAEADADYAKYRELIGQEAP